jgi:hypothetical protein
MSGLIDIWTVERERMARTRQGGVQVFKSVAWFGASERQRRAPRSESDGTGKTAGASAMAAAEKVAAASGCASAPAAVHEEAFLSILVDCFGQ